jgi:hypothetical protein
MMTEPQPPETRGFAETEFWHRETVLHLPKSPQTDSSTCTDLISTKNLYPEETSSTAKKCSKFPSNLPATDSHVARNSYWKK